MLQAKDFLQLARMPSWQDISLPLYKEFSELYLLTTTFRYYLENEEILDIKFTEWGIYHMLGIQHIDGKISKVKFFNKIDNGLDFQYFAQNDKLRKRLNDFKHRIRMFACCYQIMKNQNLFYIQNGKLSTSPIKLEYIKYALIDQKGVNIGIRNIDGEYVALTLLIDRSIRPQETIDGLKRINIIKLEVIRNGNIIETIEY